MVANKLWRPANQKGCTTVRIRRFIARIGLVSNSSPQPKKKAI